MTPAAHVCPADQVGKERRAELAEFTEGMIFAVDRETDRRLFGVISVTDGEPVGLTAFQISFRKDDILRPTSLSLATHPMRGADRSGLLFEHITAGTSACPWQARGTPRSPPCGAIRCCLLSGLKPKRDAGTFGSSTTVSWARTSAGQPETVLVDASMACRGRRSARVSGRSASSSAVGLVGMTTARDRSAMPPKLSQESGRLEPR